MVKDGQGGRNKICCSFEQVDFRLEKSASHKSLCGMTKKLKRCKIRGSSDFFLISLESF